MIAISDHDGVRSITLERAERGNALSGELVEVLITAVQQTSADASLHTMVLCANGKNFCTGFDLSDLETSSDGDLLLRFVRVEQLLAAIWQAPMRTVAIAQGRAWGAGADLFACCDERVVLKDASFRFPGAGFGLVLGTRRLAERVGVDRARAWIIEGRQVSAEQALESGMATDLATDAASARGRLVQIPAVSPATARQIRSASRADLSDTDLAALVRSASLPGLKQRIIAYRDALRRTSGKD